MARDGCGRKTAPLRRAAARRGGRGGSPLLCTGTLLAGAKVSLVPRREAPAERLTDAQGRALWTPKEGNDYLVVAHRDEP
jgi:hypothetical protein